MLDKCRDCVLRRPALGGCSARGRVHYQTRPQTAASPCRAPALRHHSTSHVTSTQTYMERHVVVDVRDELHWPLPRQPSPAHVVALKGSIAVHAGVGKKPVAAVNGSVSTRRYVPVCVATGKCQQAAVVSELELPWCQTNGVAALGVQAHKLHSARALADVHTQLRHAKLVRALYAVSGGEMDCDVTTWQIGVPLSLAIIPPV